MTEPTHQCSGCLQKTIEDAVEVTTPLVLAHSTCPAPGGRHTWVRRTFEAQQAEALLPWRTMAIMKRGFSNRVELLHHFINICRFHEDSCQFNHVYLAANGEQQTNQWLESTEASSSMVSVLMPGQVKLSSFNPTEVFSSSVQIHRWQVNEEHLKFTMCQHLFDNNVALNYTADIWRQLESYNQYTNRQRAKRK